MSGRKPPIFEAREVEAHRDGDRVAIEIVTQAHLAMVFHLTLDQAWGLAHQLHLAAHQLGSARVNAQISAPPPHP